MGRELSLTLKLYSTLNRKKNFLANRARHYVRQLGFEVFLLLGPVNLLIRMGSVLANMAGYYIN